MKKYLFILIGFCFLSSCKKTEFNRQEMLSNIAKNSIESAFNNFINSSSELSELLNNLAKNHTKENFDLAKQQCVDVMIAWAKCEPFLIGPMGESLMENKIANRPVLDELLEKNLTSSDGEINADFLNLQGSRVKGLAGLEYLLFMDDALAKLIESPKRMTYLLLVGKDLAINASKIAEMWANEKDGYRLVFSATDDVDMGSTLTMLMSKISEVTNMIYIEKLDKAFFKVKYEKGSVVGFEAWRSKASKDLVKANLLSIQSVFENGLYDYLKYLDGDDLVDKISAQFLKIEKSVSTIPVSFEEDSDNHLDKYPIIINDVRQLLVLFKAETANKLGVTISYAGNDGD